VSLVMTRCSRISSKSFFFFQAEDGIRDRNVTGVQTCALPILALLARRKGEPDVAVEYLEQCIALGEKLGDRWSVARCLYLLGRIASERDDHHRARALMHEALAVFTELSASPAAARGARSLGRLQLAAGRILEARTSLTTCFRISFASGQRIAVARALEALGE